MQSKGGPRKFSQEFRREAVRLARESGRSVRAISAELGISDGSLRNWMREASGDEHTSGGRVLSLEDEVRQLRRDNERLREEREILKKAAAFFARDGR
jgi:transposase